MSRIQSMGDVTARFVEQASTDRTVDNRFYSLKSARHVFIVQKRSSVHWKSVAEQDAEIFLQSSHKNKDRALNGACVYVAGDGDWCTRMSLSAVLMELNNGMNAGPEFHWLYTHIRCVDWPFPPHTSKIVVISHDQNHDFAGYLNLNY